MAVMLPRLLGAAVGLVLLLTQPLSALAQNKPLTAGGILEVCTTASMHWVDFCNGFFQAVHDHASINGIACTPTGVTRTDLVELYQREVLRLIETDPSVANRVAVSVGTVILGKAYPCQ